MFIQKLTELLLARDYVIVPQLCDNEFISDNSQYITFFKHSGSILYAVAILNTELMPDATRAYVSLYNRFHDFCNSVRCTQAYFIGLFIGENELINDFCNHDIEDFTEFHLEMRWIVNPQENKITVKGNQPSKVIDLRGIIELAFKENTVDYSPQVHINTLVDKEKERRERAKISNNSVLCFLLILINILMFIITYSTGGDSTENLINLGALDVSLVINNHQYFRLVTATFLHYGLIHIVSNVLFLYIFGSTVERYYGKLKFALIYIFSAIGGNVLYCFFSPYGIAVGASGAVFGLTACVLAYSLKAKRAIDGRDSYFMLMFVVLSVFLGFIDTSMAGLAKGGIANSAHIGGALVGFLLGIFLYPKENLK